MKQKHLYSIGDAAALSAVSVKTLRYYDQIGLVVAEKNQETGYRYYRKEQLLQIQLVKRLKELHFALDEIQEFLSGKNIDTLEKSLQLKLEKIETQIESLHVQHSDAMFFLDRLRQGKNILTAMNPDISPEEFSAGALGVEQIPAKSVLSIRRIMEDYKNEEINIDRWGELLELVRKAKAIPVGPITVTYHNAMLEHFYTNVCDYEVQIEVMGGENSPNYKQIDSFPAVTTVHVGNYENLIKPYLSAMKWATDNGYKIKGPMSDMFIVSPIDTRDENEYLTKIIIPIETDTL